MPIRKTVDCDATQVLEDESTMNRLVGVLLVVGWSLFTAVLLVNFVRLSWRSSLIKGRFVTFVYLQVFGAAFQLLWSVTAVVGRANIPCILGYLLPLSVMTLQAVPYVIRLLLFHNKILLTQWMANAEYKAAIAGTAEHYKMKPTLEVSPPLGDHPLVESISGSDRHTIGITSITSTQRRVIKRLRSLSTQGFGLLIYLLCILFWLVATITGKRHLLGCYGCDIPDSYFIEVYSISLFIIFIVAVLMYRIWNEPDPMHIKHDLMFVAASALLGITGFILTSIDPGETELEGRFTWAHLWVLCCFFLVYGLLRFPILLLKLNNTARSMRLSFDAQSVTFDDIMKSSTSRKLFKAHLMQKFRFENYLFYIDVKKWKAAFKNPTIQIAALERSKQLILNKYIGSHTPYAINIGSEVMKTLKKPVPNITVQDFDDALEEVSMLLELNVLPRFRETEEFRQYFHP